MYDHNLFRLAESYARSHGLVPEGAILSFEKSTLIPPDIALKDNSGQTIAVIDLSVLPSPSPEDEEVSAFDELTAHVNISSIWVQLKQSFLLKASVLALASFAAWSFFSSQSRHRIELATNFIDLLEDIRISINKSNIYGFAPQEAKLYRDRLRSVEPHSCFERYRLSAIALMDQAFESELSYVRTPSESLAFKKEKLSLSLKNIYDSAKKCAR